jgi:sugar phosphate isomerase/epimerase
LSSRRTFIQHGSMIALATSVVNSRLFAFNESEKLPALGIQLYMVKEDMEKDPAGTLARLGRMGYSQIESFGGNNGIFWGFSNKAFNQMAEANGLNIVSSHYAGDSNGFEETAAAAAEIGMKYLIYPWKGPQKSIDDFKKIADEFNGYGSICKKHGIRFAYHPHDYPYKMIDGQLPIDILLDHTDEQLVDFEMDFYYTVTEGKDPEYYLKKYKPRFRLCHMRDVLKIKLPKGSVEESACDLGEGIINYSHLLPTCLNCGMQYFFVEQSRFFNETPLHSAEVNANYLKSFNF